MIYPSRESPKAPVKLNWYSLLFKYYLLVKVKQWNFYYWTPPNFDPWSWKSKWEREKKASVKYEPANKAKWQSERAQDPQKGPPQNRTEVPESPRSYKQVLFKHEGREKTDLIGNPTFFFKKKDSMESPIWLKKNPGKTLLNWEFWLKWYSAAAECQVHVIIEHLKG